MKTLMMIAAAGALAALAGCQTNTPTGNYANPLDACASITDEEDQAQCMRNVVADVAISTKREKDRKRAP